jgi:hypothetical protein
MGDQTGKWVEVQMERIGWVEWVEVLRLFSGKYKMERLERRMESVVMVAQVMTVIPQT